MNTQVEINHALPKIGKEILNKLTMKQISIEEFNKECAYWMIDTLKEMNYKPNPTEPEIIRNYEIEKDRDPKYAVANTFWNRDDVKDYMKQKSLVYNLNYANWYWIKFIKRWLPAEDLPNQNKVSQIMKSYSIRNNWTPSS